MTRVDITGVSRTAPDCIVYIPPIKDANEANTKQSPTGAANKAGPTGPPSCSRAEPTLLIYSFTVTAPRYRAESDLRQRFLVTRFLSFLV